MPLAVPGCPHLFSITVGVDVPRGSKGAEGAPRLCRDLDKCCKGLLNSCSAIFTKIVLSLRRTSLEPLGKILDKRWEVQVSRGKVKADDPWHLVKAIANVDLLAFWR